MLDLDPIKERLKNATPGPWAAQKISSPDTMLVAPVATNKRGHPDFSLQIETNNAILIANAPTDIAMLIEEVEELRTKVNPTYCELASHVSETLNGGTCNSTRADRKEFNDR